MDTSFPLLFNSAACTTLSCIFLVNAGSELREGMWRKGENVENNEGDGKEKKKHFVLSQDVQQFRIFPSGQINRLLDEKSGL